MIFITIIAAALLLAWLHSTLRTLDGDPGTLTRAIRWLLYGASAVPVVVGLACLLRHYGIGSSSLVEGIIRETLDAGFVLLCLAAALPFLAMAFKPRTRIEFQPAWVCAHIALCSTLGWQILRTGLGVT